MLGGLARQRVAVKSANGKILVIERALQRTGIVEADLHTCLMRGWIEVLHKDMPSGSLEKFFNEPDGSAFTKTETIYRLTEGGWAARNRAHAWTLINSVIGVIAIIVAVLLASAE